MQKLLVTVAALAVLAACGGAGRGTADADTATSSTLRVEPDQPTATSGPSSTVEASTTATTAVTAPATTPQPAPERARTTRPECSEGGSDAAAELQRSFDQGHQPWRADPLAVAGAGAACHFGGAATSVEPAGSHRYLATDAGTGDQAFVELTQPLGAGTVWLVAAVTPT